MEKEEIEEIKRRCEAASPEPWELESVFGIPNLLVKTGPKSNDFLQASTYADNIFIANARTDVPKLLSALEASQREVEGLREDNTGLRNLIKHVLELDSIEERRQVLLEALARTEKEGGG